MAHEQRNVTETSSPLMTVDTRNPGQASVRVPADATSSVYLLNSSGTASSSSCTVEIVPGGYYEVPAWMGGEFQASCDTGETVAVDVTYRGSVTFPE